jgi:hypothetical protein
MTARFAEGDRSYDCASLATFRSSARVAGLSSGTSTWICCGWDPGRSITQRYPPFSKTIESPPMLGHFTS